MLVHRSYANRMFSSKNMSMRDDQKHQNSYSVPQTKLRNITCVYCKRHFTIRGILLKDARLPLLLKCGHSACEECGKQKEPCPICKVIMADDENSRSLLPLNVYTIGLTVIMQNFSDIVNDPDLAFCPSVGSKLRHSQNQKLCSECGIPAILQCQQCTVLLCSPCFSKIHGRALQHHNKILLSHESNDNPLVIRNTCSFDCNEPLQYYCKQCDVSGCPHCMIRLHPKHDYITQKEKNEELLPEFQEIYEQIAGNLQRILQAQKKLKKVLVFPSELQNSESVEASINQHFVYLHGVLQNLEKKMINKLHEQRNYLNRNLEDISTQLREQEEQLQGGLLLAASIKDSIDRVNLNDVIAKLKDFTDIPCHLVQDVVPKNEQVEFKVDMSVISAIEEHCKVKVPTPTGFSLLPTVNLPLEYNLEPLPEDMYMQNLLERSLVPVLKSASSTQSVDSSKSDNMVLTVGSSTGVRIFYIENPSCFYVLPNASVDDYVRLEKSIQIYAKRDTPVSTDIAKNKLYIFQRQGKKWCRGRVLDVDNDSENKAVSCKMFCIDLGNVEDHVPVSKIKSIPPEFITLPALAKKCSIHDIVPRYGKWQKEATQYMINIKIKSQTGCVTMYVIKEEADTYYVDLHLNSYKNDNRLSSIRDNLVYLGHGSLASQQKLMRTNPQSVQRFYNEELELESYVDVVCLNVESPDAIYVRKTSEHSAHFEKAMDEMMKDYQINLKTKVKIFVPEVGLPCAALDGTGKWRRAVIIDITADVSVLVLYVDIGRKAILPCESIRRLPDYYMKCRTQAIKVSLRDIKPANDAEHWGEHVIQHVQPFLMQKQVQVVASEKLGDSYSVYMYLPTRENVNRLLVGNNLACSTGMNTQQSTRKKKNKGKKKGQGNVLLPICDGLDKTDSTIIDSDINSKNLVRLKEKELEQKSTDPFKIHVRVHRAESPNCIYVSDPTSEQKNTCLMKEIQDFYSKYYSDQVHSWEKGVVCAVYSSANKCYCRAKIIDIICPEEVTVFLYDMGITETVEMKNIQLLSLKFVNTPAYLFQIKLAGILPCGGSTSWPSSSCRKLNEIIDQNQNCKFYISKMIPNKADPAGQVLQEVEVAEDDDDVGNKAVPVELWVKQSKTEGPLLPTRIEINSVNRMLIDEGYALPNKEYNEKGEKLLAIELQRQLAKKLAPVANFATRIKWSLIYNEPNVSSNNSSTWSIPKTFFNDLESSTEQDVEDDIPIPPKMSKWIPAVQIMEDQFLAVGSYLDENCILYIHPKTDGYNRLSYIDSKLADVYKKVRIKPYSVDWSEGDLCIAQYHYNKKWCRGVVQKVYYDDNRIQVQFVDYGNAEDCELETVTNKVILGDIPIQCMRCKIHGLEPNTPDGKWATKDLDKIHALLVDKEFTVYVFRRTSTHLVVTIHLYDPEVEELIGYLYNELKINIKMQESLESTTPSEGNSCDEDVVISDNQEIMFEEYRSDFKQVSDISNVTLNNPDEIEENDDDLVSGSPTFARLQNRVTDNVVEVMSDIGSVDEDAVVTSTPQNESREHFQPSYTPLKISNNITVIEIKPCCYVDLTICYAQLTENVNNPILNTYYKQYNKLMKDIQKHIYKQPKIKSIELNSPCCARYNDGVWYRCIIIECVANNDSEVDITLKFVDFGNEEVLTLDVNNHDLYALKEEWFNVPTMAMKCKLWNIEVIPEVNLPLIAPKVEEMYDESVVVVAKIINYENNDYEVELYTNEDCKTLLYSFFIKEGIFILKKANED